MRCVRYLRYGAFLLALFPIRTLACHIEHCEVNASTKYSCDELCTGSTCSETTLSHCDVCPVKCVGGANNGLDCQSAGDCPGGTCVTGDGRCVMCGSDSNETITGSTGDDVICTAGGADTVDARGGNDQVVGGGRVVDASGNPVSGRSGTAGNLVIDGGPGNDTITSKEGDDLLLGGGGNDVLVACGGRNVVYGDDGNDTVASGLIITCTPSDDAVGSLLCGGTGNDILFGGGPSHQCMDAGPDQSPSGQDCIYSFFVNPSRSATSCDIGTARNCANANVTVGGERCGCD